MWMLVTNRLGVTASSSSRVHVTELAGSASAFFEMKTRPVVVAAQAVEVSPVVRSIAAAAGPARSPQNAEVNGFAPSFSQSAHEVPAGQVRVHWLESCTDSPAGRLQTP